MADDDDILELNGVPLRRSRQQSPANAGKKFLSIWYRCCHTYGRLTRNKEGTAYQGCCPKCGSKVSARIGNGGTNRRMFEAM